MLTRPALLHVDRAIDKLLALAQPVREAETTPLADAVGRVTAHRISASCDLPPFDAAAMDGYAVRAAGHDNNRQKRFRVIGESLAGHPSSLAVAEATAVRVFTGAVLPQGADAVFLQEDAVVRHGQVSTATPVRPGDHVRTRGHDVAAGKLLCSSGTRLSPYQATRLAACGIDVVSVKRRARVAVASTGDELANPGEPLRAGEIFDSNRFALTALLRAKQTEIMDLGCLPDDRKAIRTALERASRQVDLIVTSGGVSVGNADFVKDVLEEIGTVEFWRVALKPGKPLAVGRIGDALVMGLPGNPVSAIITYLLFVAPAVDKLSGAEPGRPLTLPARINHPLRHVSGRREYMRGVLRTRSNEITVSTTGDQSSNRLATLAAANCLVVIDENTGNVAAGDLVTAIPLGAEADHIVSDR